MVTVEFSGWCCSDCIILIANGDTPPEMSEDDTAAWLAAIEKRSDGLPWVSGDGHEDFSSRSCDVCGSQDAGERFAVSQLSQ